MRGRLIRTATYLSRGRQAAVADLVQHGDGRQELDEMVLDELPSVEMTVSAQIRYQALIACVGNSLLLCYSHDAGAGRSRHDGGGRNQTGAIALWLAAHCFSSGRHGLIIFHAAVKQCCEAMLCLNIQPPVNLHRSGGVGCQPAVHRRG